MFKMRLGLLLVLTWVCCASAYTQRSCNDCKLISSCEAAIAAFKKGGAESKLKRAHCGFEGSQPMVCCSDFAVTPTETRTTEDNDLEGHKNLPLLPEVCGKINGDKIVGGKFAGIYDFPWMALISYHTRDGLQFQCGGSLINERYVLTAAHCIADAKIAGVRLGELEIDESPDCQGESPNFTCESFLQDVRVEESIMHEQYRGKPTVENDIGLLRLKNPVDVTAHKNVAPVCLPVTRELLTRDVGTLNATVAGWGYTETGYVSTKLLAVDVPIYTHEACRQKYHRGSQSTTDPTLNKLCAGEVGKDSCGGDSGGPLMVKGPYKSSGHRFIQHGIVSYGPKLCGSNYPGVYTDVTKYMKWILDHIKQ